MGWNPKLEFHERFTVTRCQSPDYCAHCNEMIKKGHIKVAWKGLQFHKGCIEDRLDRRVRVNIETMKVEKHEPDT